MAKSWGPDFELPKDDPYHALTDERYGHSFELFEEMWTWDIGVDSLKSLNHRLFDQHIRDKNKFRVTITLRGESTVDWWIPLTKGK